MCRSARSLNLGDMQGPPYSAADREDQMHRAISRAGTMAAAGSCPPRVRALPAGCAAAIASTVAVLRLWRDRERERRELATLSARDLHEIGASPSLVRFELRRWPWQTAVLGAGQAERPSVVEPTVDAMQCIVFPFAPRPAHLRNAA